ncbi:hypothetical protein EVAR_64345_1 [Eumeta japonica]|uniref:Uncharacterized protein n=1 Tax=Eumeta variegata TaxID=151549 RepID=A0A4C1ZQS7_EUMVA|nr:hypothetical protein EVAR_64345_1 [Eumeta japonica]
MRANTLAYKFVHIHPVRLYTYVSHCPFGHPFGCSSDVSSIILTFRLTVAGVPQLAQPVSVAIEQSPLRLYKSTSRLRMWRRGVLRSVAASTATSALALMLMRSAGSVAIAVAPFVINSRVPLTF